MAQEQQKQITLVDYLIDMIKVANRRGAFEIEESAAIFNNINVAKQQAQQAQQAQAPTPMRKVEDVEVEAEEVKPKKK